MGVRAEIVASQRRLCNGMGATCLFLWLVTLALAPLTATAVEALQRTTAAHVSAIGVLEGAFEAEMAQLATDR
ncbi:hypothetical protein M885DRAFT_566732 [Pelagophyceae sp. CCMP2097]|nr:hypothetical protein M885DRAFT_566732 [Pelagophyceae sp. CCMP2097]